MPSCKAKEITSSKIQDGLPAESPFLTVRAIGTAVPPPPQLRHFMYPVWLHDWQPASPSDHRLQKQVSRPVPPHVGHGSPLWLGCAAFCVSISAPQATATEVATAGTAEATLNRSAMQTVAATECVRCRRPTMDDLPTANRQPAMGCRAAIVGPLRPGRPRRIPVGAGVIDFIPSRSWTGPLLG